MTTPKAWMDLAHSLDADWPPHQPITLTDLVAGARAVDWDFTASCYASGYDASDPDARRMFDCLLAYSGTRASRACIDQPPAHLVQTAAPPGGSTSLRDNVRSLPCSSGGRRPVLDLARGCRGAVQTFSRIRPQRLECCRHHCTCCDIVLASVGIELACCGTTSI